ncbi:MAG: hypothetical protein IJD43_14240 [Thermoguttaceae bacterium]|nr:hypothetical protein [Thermoguttaceae bacterium]
MPFLWPWTRISCPFCFEEFHLSEAPTRPSEAKTLFPDEKMRDFLGMTYPPEMPMAIEPPENWFLKSVRKFHLPLCREVTPESPLRICPNCHLYLPQALANWNRRSNIIAIVGSRSSGKSNYFGVLLKQLETRYAAELNFGFRPQMTFDVREMRRMDSRKLYERRYGQRLFRDHRVIQQTERSEVDADIKIPLIYRLTLSQTVRGKERLRAIDLVIFDAAGEDLSTMRNFHSFGRYALNASGIIVMVDPFRYPAIYHKLPPETRSRIPAPDAIGGNPGEILDYYLSYKTNESALRPDEKIKTPTALVLTKIDMLRQILPRESQSLFQETNHSGGFNRKVCERKSEQILQFLTENGAGDLAANIRTQFETSSFFGVSALGVIPEGEAIPRQIRPINVVDPLLWILHQLKYLNARSRP